MNIKQILKETVKGSKEIDFYVPVKIEFKKNDNEDRELFYYQLINKNSSLIEMSINSATEKIVEITIVSINEKATEYDIKLDDTNMIYIEGNPLIDMTQFKENHIITDNLNFNIICKEHKIYALQNAEIVYRVKMDSVELLMDRQKVIRGFIFSEFSDREWTEIQESIESFFNSDERLLEDN